MSIAHGPGYRAAAALFLIFAVAWTVHSRAQAPARQAGPLDVPPEIEVAVDAGREVAVIIGVAPGWAVRPEPFLTAGDAAQQRLDIAAAQDSVIAELIAAGSPWAASAVRFGIVPFFSTRINTSALAALRASPLVTSIEEDRVSQLTLAESIPLIRADQAWAAGATGSGWTVAVLDSGVDKAHPFVSGKVVSEACYSNGSGLGTSVCPGGATQSVAPGSAAPCLMTQCEHGTHVAGIAAGRSPTVSGVARDASIIAIQVATNANGVPGISATDWMRGLQRVYELRTTYKIAAANMSLGSGQFFSYCDFQASAEKAMIDTLSAAGIAVVVASGNNGFPNAVSYPACISSAITVGSTDDGSGGTVADAVSNFSNRASFVDLMAPGRTITSSVPGGGFQVINGTSMAAPHVAGAWAVLKQARASAGVADVLEALQRTGAAIQDNALRFARINVGAAVPALVTAPTTFFSGGIPVGVATDLQGNVYVQYDSGLLVFVTKLTPGGERVWTTQLGNQFDVGLSGRMALDPDFGLFLLSDDGRLTLFDAATGGVRGQVNLRGLPIDASAVYDAALDRVASFNGLVAGFNSNYGDLALFRRGADLDLFITAVSVGRAYVARVPLSAGGQLGTARVLVSSTLTSAGTVNLSPGVAVDSAGTVLTTITRIPTAMGAIDGALTFEASYTPGVSGAAPVRLFGNQDFTSVGMTAVGPGSFYVATGIVGVSACGIGASGALVRIRPAQGECHTFNRILFDSQDVAVIGNRAYVSVASAGVVQLFTLDDGSTAQLSVTIRGSAQGVVTSNIGGLDCSMGTCSATIPAGSSLVLTAAPGPGGAFRAWTGACTGTTLTCAPAIAETVTVGAIFSAAFTDPSLTTDTPIRAVHITQMRAAIDVLRSRLGLPTMVWSDPALAAGETIRAVHIDDLRAAILPAYAAAGLAAPSFTDSVIVPGVTPVRRIHATELRDAIRGLE